MIDLRKNKKKNYLSLNDKVELFKRYIPNLKLGEHSCSPFPFRKDKRPSFGVYYNRWLNDIRYKDYAHSEGNVFKFIALMEGLDYPQQMADIFKIINNKPIITYQNGLFIQPKTQIPKKAIIDFCDFTENDLIYWRQFNITKEILDIFEVKRVKQAYVEWKTNEGMYLYYSFNKSPCFYYKRGKYFQLYRPLEEKGSKKFYTNCIDNNIENFFGYYQLKNKSFNRLVLFYDNDTAGIKGAINEKNRLESKYSLLIDIFHLSDYKDISDEIKNKGITNIEKLPFTEHDLIITKSSKDVMSLYSIGISSIANHGEGVALNGKQLRKFID
jgi:hypothetical protein